MKLTHRTIALATTALAAIQSIPALAQDGASSTSGDAPIIVTARRFEENLQDVPISITVFNQAAIDDRNIVNPSELAAYTPSLSVNRQFGTEKSSFSIRGFVQELGTQPSVGVYFADVVAPRAQGPTTSGNGTFPGTLFDLQNIQVLKGPQGTLFGRNTTGGALLLVPRKPTGELEGYVEGSIGNYEARRVQAVINLPLAETFKVRLGVDRMTRDGYLRNRSTIGPRDFADVDYWSFRGSILAELTPTLENYTIFTYNDSNTHGHLARFVACAANPALRGTVPGSGTQLFIAQAGCNQLARQVNRGDGYYDVENSLTNPQVHLQQWQLINTTTWDVSDRLTIKNITSYAQFRERSRFNLGGDNLAVPPFLTFPFIGDISTGAIPPFVPSVTGTPFVAVSVQPGPSGYQAAQETFTEELQFQGKAAGGRLTWQAGGYVEISNPLRTGTQFSPIFSNCTNVPAFQCTDPLGRFTGAPGNFLFGFLSLGDQNHRFRNLGAYAQATYDISEQFSVTGGIRYTSDRIKTQSQDVRILFPSLQPGTIIIHCSKATAIILPSLAARTACRDNFVERSSKPTWLIGLDYKPSDDIMLYAKYARGYRQGTINALPLSRPLTITGPEKVDTYEIGAKASFSGAVSGTFNVSAFYNDFSNQQIQANAFVRNSPVFANVLLNAGKSRIQGVEIDASLRPFEGLLLQAAYAFLDTKLKSIVLPTNDPIYATPIPTAAVGGSLAYSPRNKLTLNGTYTLPLDESLGRVSLGATFTHTDRQYASRSTAPFLANGQLGFDPARLPATDLLNLNVNWDSVAGHPVDLSLFATNVTNEKYHVALTNFFAFGYESIIIGEPRMYGLRLKYRFGPD